MNPICISLPLRVIIEQPADSCGGSVLSIAAVRAVCA